ncbi:unnamed protein product, partial [Staurois parvus]
DFAFLGRRAALFTNSPLCRLRHTALDGCAQHRHPEQCPYSEAPTYRPPVKHSQYTVNPFCALHVNPFLPSAISTMSVLFFLALITVLVSQGMSVTPSQFPPVSECPPQSC